MGSIFFVPYILNKAKTCLCKYANVFCTNQPSLIQYAGIKHVGYSQRQWDNPQDPRLLHTAVDSHEAPSEKETVSTSEPAASGEESSPPVLEEPMGDPEEMLAKEEERNEVNEHDEDDDYQEEAYIDHDEDDGDQEEAYIDHGEDGGEQDGDDGEQDGDDLDQDQDDGEQDGNEGEQDLDEVSEEKNLTDELKSSHCQEQRVQQQQRKSAVDSIVDEQLQGFSAGMMSLLKQKQVSYRAPYTHAHAHAPSPPAGQRRTSMKPFSDYVVRHHAPVPLYGFVRTLRNSLTSYIDSHLKVALPEGQAGASPAPTTSHPSSPDSTLSSDAAPVSSASGSRSSRSSGTRIPNALAQSSPPPQHSLPQQPSSSQPGTQAHKSLPRLGTCKEAWDLDPWLAQKSEWRPEGRVAKEVDSCARVTSPLLDVSPAASSPAPANDMGSSGAGPSSSSLTHLINKLNPEMFSSLVEIIKGVRKNSVHFYVHSNDRERSQVCADIKVSIPFVLVLGHLLRCFYVLLPLLFHVVRKAYSILEGFREQALCYAWPFFTQSLMECLVFLSAITRGATCRNISDKFPDGFHRIVGLDFP